jgi:hypothetical protein
MYQVATQAFDQLAAFQISLHGCVVFKKRNGIKIGRKRADLGNPVGRTYEMVCVFMIESSQCPDNIARVCTDAKLGDPAQIYGDVHGRI